jgi:signal transduction histidine kinase
MPRLRATLQSHRAALLDDWKRRVLRDPSVPEANRLPEPALSKGVPALLDALIHRLGQDLTASQAGCPALGTSWISRDHAARRLAQEYSTASAVREFSHLRAAILSLCYAERVEVAAFEAALLHTTIDEAMTTVAVEMDEAGNRQLKRDGELRERFVAILGHDLRTPLSSVVFSAAVLLKDTELPPTTLRAVQRIARGGERMQRMIEDMLDLIRARHLGGIPLKREVISVHDLNARAIEETLARHPGRRIDLETSGSGHGSWDRDRLMQIFSNLLGNALAHSPPESAVAVRIDETDGDRVAIRIHNEGAIPEKLLPIIFEPFRRGTGDAPNAPQGLGLGLYIVREIVRAHGGVVSVASAPEQGTTFTVVLPRGLPDRLARAEDGALAVSSCDR